MNNATSCFPEVPGPAIEIFAILLAMPFLDKIDLPGSRKVPLAALVFLSVPLLYFIFLPISFSKELAAI